MRRWRSRSDSHASKPASKQSSSSSPPPPKLSPADWLQGPHRQFIEALDAFALEKATQAQASLATGVLRAMGPLPGPLSSALLGAVVGGVAPSSLSTSSSSPSAAANALRSPFPPTSDGAAALLSAVGFRPRLEIPALRRAGLTDDFDPELEAEARRLLQLSRSASSSSSSSAAASADDDPDARWRLDLTSAHRVFLAIDDASTTEVDDAVSVERGGGGGGGNGTETGEEGAGSRPVCAIWVHVADPTRWVPSPQHPLALEAARRTRTLYLPTGAVPMFPKAAAEGLFSLSASSSSGEEGAAEADGAGGDQRTEVPALSVRLPVLPDGTPDEDAEPSLHVSTLRPVTRMTYDEADAILNGSGGGSGSTSTAAAAAAAEEDLAVVAAFAAARFAARGARGAATFDLPELQVAVDIDDEQQEGGGGGGKPSLNVRVSQLWAGNSPARRAVAEAMIAANEAVALWGSARGVPLPFRGQPASSEFSSDDGGESKEGGGQRGQSRSEEQEEMEELQAVRLLLAKLQGVFDLPRRLRAALNAQAHEVAVDAYAEAAPLLRAYGHKVRCG